MRRLHLLFPILLSSGIIGACSSHASEPASPPAPEITPIFTIREIMQSMVEPRADTLWNAVSTEVTDNGATTKAPKTEDEWAQVRHEAVTLSEAMNLIQMPARKVAKPGDQPKDPKVELTPEQIEVLINQDRASWAKLARATQDATMAALKAIDARDADALSNAGGGIDASCETCHKKYWYPNEENAGKK